MSGQLENGKQRNVSLLTREVLSPKVSICILLSKQEVRSVVKRQLESPSGKSTERRLERKLKPAKRRVEAEMMNQQSDVINQQKCKPKAK